MAVIHLPNGLGESSGDSLVTAKPIEYSGNVWYVNSATGSDAASPAGKNRNEPLATLGQAVTNSIDGDLVVLMDGHVETLTAALTIDNNLTIVGAGSSGGIPTVTFTNNSAAAVMFNITATESLELRNIKFAANAQTNAQTKVDATSSLDYLRVKGCYFECGATDTGSMLATAAAVTDIRNTTFISTATVRTAQPLFAINATANVKVLAMEGVIVDGGTVGFGSASTFHAVFLNNLDGIIYAESISLLRGADITIAEVTEGYINVQTSTGGARVDWCDIVAPG